MCVCKPAQEVYYPSDDGQKPNILPPNFRAAAARRHLAKDSACGENSLAFPKAPMVHNPKAARGTTAAFDRIAIDRSKPGSGTPTGHQFVRWLISGFRLQVCAWERNEIHLYAPQAI